MTDNNFDGFSQMRIMSHHENEHFTVLAEILPHIVWRTLPDRSVNFFNRQWYEYTGLSQAESYGDGWSVVLHPEDHQRTMTLWNIALETNNFHEFEYRLQGKDGSYRWFLVKASPTYNLEGEISSWFGTCTRVLPLNCTLSPIKTN